ncbi:acetylornithine transaminase [Litchfieldia salsa]|uniref:Acetylornithine aminotransferase n=1 Tax=Litchfieldia salsa TaxID=930152 RepID=A0A1H0S7B5_9BACI|nr:acetylornithine transaminase [Litchfieldia salsa]SDP37711.1 acetylornithine aminotransferase [Litchfieldia salsa]
MNHLFPTYNRWNIKVASAKGTKIIDDQGKEYLDFVSGIAVNNLGNRNEKVQQAILEQLDQYWHVSNLYHQEPQQIVAKMLTDYSDGDSVFFCNSGAEANEAAIKLARKFTGKSKIITFKQSFHGRTFATMSATGQEKIHSGFGPLLQEFSYLDYNDSEGLSNEMDDTVAAVLLEVIQGEGGVVPAEAEFLNKVEELCKQYNALFIIDEVQTGIGRTGKPFAYQNFNLSPDIITLAKGLGSGLPIGAMVGKSYLKEAFGPGVHGSTFGGNPISIAAAKATLEIIFQDEFLDEVVEKGEYFKSSLHEALAGVECVQEIRGSGLMLGISCHVDVTAIINSLRDKGLLVLNAGPNVIRMLPPLTVSKEEISQAIELIKIEMAHFEMLNPV